MEMFTLFGARVCSVGCERRAKWTPSKSIFIWTVVVMAERILVTMQQLWSYIRARQTTTALGEESALRGHPRWAMRGGVIKVSIQGETALEMKGFYGGLTKKHVQWRIMKRNWPHQIGDLLEFCGCTIALEVRRSNITASRSRIDINAKQCSSEVFASTSSSFFFSDCHLVRLIGTVTDPIISLHGSIPHTMHRP